ncbi:hypothetical protein T310_9888 [Rasamsonia emersonii CBS 393.64]|uniref:Uncharacterized protein n=1 Tax=Rasamsonia emersonii (strain ATCC 16479 / CBS 393.64 / IMI 116815) TaxID=1408163 RepID=A0A0F4YE95_RASE3|nr:hypothetical protein T310_9888 [Rasamsonia emersonii CBS 393.64]KKA16509.1 hypothetical protein T310_9888 [Rasamsonia emersonii CBS 393.64]
MADHLEAILLIKPKKLLNFNLSLRPINNILLLIILLLLKGTSIKSSSQETFYLNIRKYTFYNNNLNKDYISLKGLFTSILIKALNAYKRLVLISKELKYLTTSFNTLNYYRLFLIIKIINVYLDLVYSAFFTY